MFDIQKFAEGAEETTETQEKISIPEELEGISEEVAREVLNEQASQEKAQSVEEKPEPTTEPEFDEEGNYTSEGKVEDVKIDYARYKETLDQKNDFEKQLKAYQEKYGDIKAQSAPQPVQQQYQQPPQQQYQQPAMQNYQQQVQQNMPEQKPPEPRYFTAEDAKQIENAIVKATMEGTGLSQEDVDKLDFLDDDDPKVLAWQGMKRYAEVATIFNIMQAQQMQAQAQYQQAMFDQQSQSVFDEYVKQQQQVQYRNEIQQFIKNEFLGAQNGFYQNMIVDANNRIGTANQTAQDVQLVMDFYDKAERAYLAKKQAKSPATPPAPKKQAPKPQFPRTDKVNGIPGSGGGITNASLAEMMRNTAWDKIPQQYKDILLNATT